MAVVDGLANLHGCLVDFRNDTVDVQTVINDSDK